MIVERDYPADYEYAYRIIYPADNERTPRVRDGAPTINNHKKKEKKYYIMPQSGPLI